MKHRDGNGSIQTIEICSLELTSERSYELVTAAIFRVPQNAELELVLSEAQERGLAGADSWAARRWPGFQVQGVPVYCL